MFTSRAHFNSMRKFGSGPSMPVSFWESQRLLELGAGRGVQQVAVEGLCKCVKIPPRHMSPSYCCSPDSIPKPFYCNACLPALMFSCVMFRFSALSHPCCGRTRHPPRFTATTGSRFAAISHRAVFAITPRAVLATALSCPFFSGTIFTISCPVHPTLLAVGPLPCARSSLPHSRRSCSSISWTSPGSNCDYTSPNSAPLPVPSTAFGCSLYPTRATKLPTN